MGQDCQYTYISFWRGKRSCLAKEFAFLEICIVVAMIYRQFELHLLSEKNRNEIFIESYYPPESRKNDNT